MFITLKRRALIVLAALLACSALLVGLTATEIKTAATANGKTVVIDAGHGGIDGGVVGTLSGMKESEINLGIAKSLQHFLKKAGYNVVMTRKGSGGLYERGADSLKRSDMQARKKIIEQAAPDLMISIHQNFYPLSSVSGAQVFYDADSENGRSAATFIQNVLNDSLGKARNAKTGDYYVLQCSPYPSVLVECGFLSNPEEEKKLISSEYQEKVAYALYVAISAYLTPDTTNSEQII